MKRRSLEDVFPEELAGRYVPVRKLGQGAMGLLVLARDKELSRLVAVKLLTLEPDPEMKERMAREAAALAAIEHDNVVRVYGSGETARGPYMVMEYLDGEAIRTTTIEHDPLEAMLEIAGALEAVHAAGILHRDLKPDNIMLTREGRPVLIDFGLAKDQRYVTLTREGLALGSLAYMAPERLQGARATRATDWYAWGASLYQISEEGRLPYGQEELRMMLSGDEVPPRPFRRVARDGRIARVVSACLAHDPAERPDGVKALRRVMLPGEDPEPSPDATTAPRPTPVSEAVSKIAPAVDTEIPEAEGRRLPVPPLAALGLLALVFVAADWRLGESGRIPVPLPRVPDAVTAPPEAASLARVAKELGPYDEERGRDPDRWSRDLESLPETAAVVSRLVRGERLEEADELRELGRRARPGLGADPFHPYLHVEPVRGSLATPTFVRGPGARALEARGRVDGWLGRGLVAHDRLRRGLERRQVELEAVSRRDPNAPDLPLGPLGVLSLSSGLQAYSRASLAQAVTRGPVARWLREEHAALREAIWCFARHAREHPEEGELASMLARDVSGESDAAWFGPWTFGPLQHWTGPQPESIGEWMILATCARRLRRVRLVASADTDELFAPEAEAWRAVLAVGPTNGFFPLAADRLIELLSLSGDHEGALTCFREHRDVLLGDRQSVTSRTVGRVVQLWIDGRGGGPPDPVELAEVTDWAEANRALWKERDAARVTRQLAELARKLGTASGPGPDHRDSR